MGMTVPTKWVKFVVAIFLLPLCAILTQTFFTVFARAAVTQRFWAGEEFWFFSLGAILWMIAFFGLPKPLLMYVFGHELTHAIWVWLMGGRVSQFRVGREGGHVVTTKNNFWIALAPYFFPLYSIIALAVFGLLSLAVDMTPFGRLLYAIIGITWAFHLTFTLWMIPKSQTDLTHNGTFFSLVLIYLMNLLLLSVMLIVASPHITFADFGAEMGQNVGRFFDWLGGLFDRFAQGYHR
jgi:drug/metabolite transporter superfamily protein YnfA